MVTAQLPPIQGRNPHNPKKFPRKRGHQAGRRIKRYLRERRKGPLQQNLFHYGGSRGWTPRGGGGGKLFKTKKKGPDLRAWRKSQRPSKRGKLQREEKTRGAAGEKSGELFTERRGEFTNYFHGK